MQFLHLNELTEWCAERGAETTGAGITLAAPARLAHGYRGRYANGQRSGREPMTADALVAALGEWQEALLWITEWGVWPSSENWPRYYAARGDRGERLSLDAKPGHLFAASETSDLALFLMLVMEQAWGAHLLVIDAAGSLTRHITISHDEWFEFRSSEPTAFGNAVA